LVKHDTLLPFYILGSLRTFNSAYRKRGTSLIGYAIRVTRKISMKPHPKKLTNHSQLFFLHSTVISQFLTLTVSFTTATTHCRRRIRAITHKM